MQAALELIVQARVLAVALPYTALPGGAHLSKRYVSTGQCLLSMRRFHQRERGRVVLREFIAVFFGVWPTNGEAA